ncbi:MAG: porphobilinogen synthase [Candidatus Sumerlaeaceae bacterium]|nr:porphobilinogen synthase [Candidatus Sumerlaeaceae bacterium]
MINTKPPAVSAGVIRRHRRLRATPAVRALVCETRVGLDDLVMPMFAIEGTGRREDIAAMPGIQRLTPDLLAAEAADLADRGLCAILLFGVPHAKDDLGSGAYADDGVVQQAVRAVKGAAPDLVVITDVCLCAYTTHGHCGVVRDGRILNDETVALLARTAVSHARAGADMIAPSDMMDGRVAAIRAALDADGFTETPIMAYAAKLASAFYGPFREAAHSAPATGDRKSHQLNPANAREALAEAMTDLDEGADIVMVKPAMPCLDLIARLRTRTDAPIAAYQVSGEYAMLKAAAANGWLDEPQTVRESLTSIKRAGADIIITYYAAQIARGTI